MNEDSQASKHEQLAMISAFMDAPPGSGKISSSSNTVTVVERLLKKANTKIHTHLHTKTRNGTNIIEEFVRVT